MLTIRWTDDCVIGVELVDEQHKKLLELMNSLAEAIEEKKTKEDTNVDLVKIADELNHYMDEHFRDEEKLYREKGIDITEHKDLHTDFVNRLHMYRNALVKGDDILKLLEVYRELLDWFMNHIKVEDKELWQSK